MTGSASGKLNRFSEVTPGVSYTLNSSFWLSSIDLTGICVWNDWLTDVGVECHGGGVAVSLSDGDRTSVIHASHVNLPVGTVMKWLGNDGNLVTRTAISISQYVGGSDIQVTTIDSPLPSTVKVYSIYRGTITNTRAVRTNQFAEARIVKVSASNGFVSFGLDSDYPDWDGLPISGDSGYPVMLLISGELQAISEQFHTAAGPDFASYL